MLNNLLKYLVLLCPLVTRPIQGFWWRSTTTEAPSEPVMKQIPLTYFRTYTYQPMAGNPLPFPLMSSTDYISNYAALANNPYFNSMMSVLPQGVPVGVASGGVTGNEITTSKYGTTGYRPAKSYAGVNGVRSLNNGYLTPPTTSTSTSSSTTTTTTPKPTTTTSTTSTSTTTTTTPTPSTTTTPATTSTETSLGINESESSFGSTTGPLIKADALVNIDAAYPAFNRKVYTNHFNINYNRPVYPFPEYSIYKPSGSSGNANKNEDPAATQFPSPTMPTTTNVEFVPCMCPVNIQGGYPSGMPPIGNPSNSIFLAQGRTNTDVEADTEVPKGWNLETPTSDAAQAEILLPNYVDDLQVVSMDDSEDVVTPSNGLVS